jgi:hypothetical protein
MIIRPLLYYNIVFIAPSKIYHSEDGGRSLIVTIVATTTTLYIYVCIESTFVNNHVFF